MCDLRRKLKKVAPDLFKKTPVLFAYLYRPGGVRPSCTDSHFNVGVYVEDMTPGACLDLALSLTVRLNRRIAFRQEIEVWVLTQMPLVIKGEIMAGGVLIYSRDEVKRIKFENQTRELYFDLMPAIQQFQAEQRQKAR